jgi:hypothetical protein
MIDALERFHVRLIGSGVDDHLPHCDQKREGEIKNAARRFLQLKISKY